MTRFDLTPLFRSTIGFDHLSHLMDKAFEQAANESSYPPYNIEKISEDDYRITMAVAGFSEEDLDITSEDNSLIVRGQSKNQDQENQGFLYRGIAARGFERRFQLADYVRVQGANLENGILSIHLLKEIPEHKRPRTIEIQKGKSGGLLEGLTTKAKGKSKAA